MPNPLRNLFRPKRDIAREELIYPPHTGTSRGSKGIFAIFAVVTIAIIVFALVITFTTDVRQDANDAVMTETAEIYNTAAANSTSTAAAGGSPAAGAPTGTPPAGIATVEATPAD
ncbi:MAG TPA: hypothetical protein VGT61_07865 [Thermomicrobiales bacterium]|jgi:hypothetical protein|nr:hypothetical protein [Thermomicrobiales bacterium]